MQTRNKILSATACLLLFGQAAFAQNDREQQAQKTEVWEPEPKVVSAPLNAPPSDAVVLFGGNSLSQWLSVKGGDAPWQLTDGVMTVAPGSGDIRSKAEFCDVQLHLEWRVPAPEPDMQGQQRNNSGVFLQQRYEIQILDSFENRTYSNGQAGSLYKQAIPLVNAMREPGQWQSYDIIFKAPRFDGDKLTQPGFITVLHNGVLVQNHTQIQGDTVWLGQPSYTAHGCAPIQLQDHGNLVSFRNIWARPL
ncbi:3-keto-disaccharide hydrolase [Bowmanella pacifica]|uniref:Large, multifunctional secreted protein n=1 Tax=Bowmanella pacifica TaxID=502051 RepID=A0A918DIR1_9ALTE|nr:DUF1080 domain-containing protein [Bowmanella pacifica]GGO68395.1 large, multifunctional secreted protein [Bowmanella pacifica]